MEELRKKEGLILNYAPQQLYGEGDSYNSKHVALTAPSLEATIDGVVAKALLFTKKGIYLTTKLSDLGVARGKWAVVDRHACNTDSLTAFREGREITLVSDGPNYTFTLNLEHKETVSASQAATALLSGITAIINKDTGIS